MSDELDALLATTELERSRADGIRSLIAASRLAAEYQARAEKAEAALARVRAIVADPHAALVADRIRAALELALTTTYTPPAPDQEARHIDRSDKVIRRGES